MPGVQIPPSWNTLLLERQDSTLIAGPATLQKPQKGGIRVTFQVTSAIPAALAQ